MTTGHLPQPEAPGPVPGEPGHFAHHDWLEASVGILNQRLLKAWHCTIVGNMATSAWVNVVTDAVSLDTGLDITADQQAGGLVMGDSAPAGLYRFDWGVGIQANTSGNRQGCVAINGTQQANTKVIIGPHGTGNTQTVVSGSCFLNVPAKAIIAVQAYQNSGATLTFMNSTTRIFLEYLGAFDPEGTSVTVLDLDGTP